MQALYGFKFISLIDLKKYYKKILKEFLWNTLQQAIHMENV
jgi:hypothetical protein